MLYDRAKSLQDQLPYLITTKEKDQSDDENNFLASDQMIDDTSPTHLEVPKPVAIDPIAGHLIYLVALKMDNFGAKLLSNMSLC